METIVKLSRQFDGNQVVIICQCAQNNYNCYGQTKQPDWICKMKKSSQVNDIPIITISW